MSSPPIPVSTGEGAFDPSVRWFQHAVFYEVLIRGYMDANNDGTGDLRGLREKLDYMEERRHQRVIGQDEAVEAVANALRRAHSTEHRLRHSWAPKPTGPASGRPDDRLRAGEPGIQ